MSHDEKIAKNLIHTLENGKLGFETAAEKVSVERPDVAASFRKFSQERAAMSAELTSFAGAYGDDIEQRSSVPGAIHRGWMAVKDAVSSDDAAAVINAAESGEDHAVSEYKDAVADDDISPEFRSLISGQLTKVQAGHDFVSGLAHSL